MFITRMTRHDKSDLMALYEGNGWSHRYAGEGTSFIARDGLVVGAVQIVEVEANVLVVPSLLVKEGRRGEGIGRQLLQTAMNSRGGTLYLCCHPERLAFYDHFGFDDVGIEACPGPVVEFFEKVGDYPAPEGHEHHYLKAR